MRGIRTFLARLPADLRLEYAILYGFARERGEDRPDSDADLALILAEGEGDWQLERALATARELQDHDPDGSVNRSYDAMFDIARAALLSCSCGH
jgi:predicted nucleotidyltransferase